MLIVGYLHVINNIILSLCTEHIGEYEVPGFSFIQICIITVSRPWTLLSTDRKIWIKCRDAAFTEVTCNVFIIPKCFHVHSAWVIYVRSARVDVIS